MARISEVMEFTFVLDNRIREERLGNCVASLVKGREAGCLELRLLKSKNILQSLGSFLLLLSSGKAAESALDSSL